MESSSSDRLPPMVPSLGTQREIPVYFEPEVAPPPKREIKQVSDPDERMQFIAQLWAHIPISLLKMVQGRPLQRRISSNNLLPIDSEYLSGKFLQSNVNVIRKRSKPLNVQLADALPQRFKDELERIRQARQSFQGG